MEAQKMVDAKYFAVIGSVVQLGEGAERRNTWFYSSQSTNPASPQQKRQLLEGIPISQD